MGKKIKSAAVISAMILLSTVCEAQTGRGAKSVVRDDTAQKAVALFEAGQNAHQAGNLDEAIRLYRQAIGMDAELWQAEFQLAAAYKSVKKLAEAKASIGKVIEQLGRYADSPELKGVSARAQLLLGDISLAQGDSAGAETAYRRVTEIDPKRAGARTALAELYLAGQKFNEAAEEAGAAIAAGEDSSSIYTLLGEAQARTEKTVAALASFNEALKREPDNKRALQDRARLNLKTGKTDAAIEDMRKLVSLAPDPSFKSMLAGTLAGAKRYDDAIVLYREILQSDPVNPEARTGLAAMLITSGRGREAIVELELLIKVDQNRADMRAQLGELYLGSDPEKALENYTAAARIEPDQPTHLIGAGSAMVKLRRFEEAIGLLQKALMLKPDTGAEYFIHTNLATALFELDDFANAAREFLWILNHQQVEGNQKRAAISLYFLGICFDKLGDFEQALKAYEQFLRIASAENQLEVEKVRLRMPSLQRQIKLGQGKRKG